MFEESFLQILDTAEDQAKNLVWYSPSQIERGDHIKDDGTKGMRPWSISRKTGELLHNLVITEKPKTIVELGTSIGYSTLWLAHAAQQYGGHIHTLERIPEKTAIAKEYIENAGLNNVVNFYTGEIINILHQEKFQSIDMLFMDADKSNYIMYLEFLRPYLSPHAIIVIDNVVSHPEKTEPAVNWCKEHIAQESKVFPTESGIFFCKT
jgi:predicted O-methyltransferase YrrM